LISKPLVLAKDVQDGSSVYKQGKQQPALPR